MRKIRLFYRDISEILGNNGFSVARLTDAESLLAICVICDKALSDQLAIRYNKTPGRDMMLPEVLLKMLCPNGVEDYELLAYDIMDGQYRVSLINRQTATALPIRMSDALLLHYISRMPFYIEEELMRRQSTSFTPGARGISIPINTLDIDHLNRELERAVAEENYRLASFLHEEIQKRNRR